MEAVKDAGKRVCGAYFEDQVSKELLESLDTRIPLNEDMLKARANI